jgi:hypothetical protein
VPSDDRSIARGRRCSRYLGSKVSILRKQHVAAFALGLLVLCSALVRFETVRSFDVPWIAPDEMVYGLVGRAFWETGRLTLLGHHAAGYGLFPVLAGLPPALFGTSVGITVLQALQALFVSSTAAVVYAWVRPAAGSGWALSAALLTALLPAFAYSGLLMTEATFLPVATLALWLLARALERPTWQRQLALGASILLAISIRMQAVVLVPILLTSIGCAAWLARDRTLVRRFVPLLVSLGLLGVFWVGASRLTTGSGASALGIYGVTASSGYDPAEAAQWVFRHAGDVFLLVVGAPLVAALLLAFEAARGRERDPRVQALVAVTVSTCLWLTAEVGVFASRYVHQLAERDLIAVAPPLFSCFAVWLSRGMPRPQPATSIVAGVVALPAVLLPVRTLVTAAAAPDAFMTIPLARVLERTSSDTLQTAWVTVAAFMIALTVLLPRQVGVLLPILVAAGLATASVLATQEVRARTRADREAFFGTTSEAWIDAATAKPVTYFYDGAADWNAVSKIAYWNRSITSIATLPGASLGPLPTTVVRPRADGTLLDSRLQPLPAHEIVASTAFTFVGTPIAENAQGPDQPGLRLWKLSGAPTLSTWTTGLKPNGDIVQPVRVRVFACGPGQLELTLLGKQGTPVEIARDGVPQRRIAPVPGTVWTGSIPAPTGADGQTVCTYDITSPGLVGSTRIEFVSTER